MNVPYKFFEGHSDFSAFPGVSNNGDAIHVALAAARQNYKFALLDALNVKEERVAYTCT